MIRPVRNLFVDKVELIGTFEQVYMDIAVTSDDYVPGKRASRTYPTQHAATPPRTEQHSKHPQHCSTRPRTHRLGLGSIRFVFRR